MSAGCRKHNRAKYQGGGEGMDSEATLFQTVEEICCWLAFHIRLLLQGMAVSRHGLLAAGAWRIHGARLGI
jgi:hypothetical protein